MILRIEDMWSPDLDPLSVGLPKNTLDYSILVQIALCHPGEKGREVFSLRVCSPGRLHCEGFVANTLVLERFEWEDVRERVGRLLLHCTSCDSWDEVVDALKGYLAYNDAT